MESCQCREKNANAFNADKIKEELEEEKIEKFNDKIIDLNSADLTEELNNYLDRFDDYNSYKDKNIKIKLW